MFDVGAVGGSGRLKSVGSRRFRSTRKAQTGAKNRVVVGAVFDDDQILPESVAQFDGDSFALRFLRFDELP